MPALSNTTPKEKQNANSLSAHKKKSVRRAFNTRFNLVVDSIWPIRFGDSGSFQSKLMINFQSFPKLVDLIKAFLSLYFLPIEIKTDRDAHWLLIETDSGQNRKKSANDIWKNEETTKRQLFGTNTYLKDFLQDLAKLPANEIQNDSL